MVVTFTKTPDGSEDYIEVSDRWRLPGLALLALLSAIAVIVIGGWQGVRALVALGLTAVIILKILLPLIIVGVPPVPLAVLTASGVTVVTILLTEGWRRSSLAAILGTTGALAITGLLAPIATSLLGFTYTAGSDLAFLSIPGGGGLDLRGILLAAIILGSVGVLDDVTVTQAVLVDEMAATGRLLARAVVSAMTIGRSHIGATVNTLFLAYVGVGLPLLVAPVGQRTTKRRGLQRRAHRDRDRPDADRQPGHRHGHPAHDVHRRAARGGSDGGLAVGSGRRSPNPHDRGVDHHRRAPGGHVRLVPLYAPRRPFARTTSIPRAR